jgi:hypothetical protein
MTTAIIAIAASQLVLAALLFGTVSLDRATVPRWLRTHPVASRHRRARAESALGLRRRQRELDRLGAAVRRAAAEQVG